MVVVLVESIIIRIIRVGLAAMRALFEKINPMPFNFFTLQALATLSLEEQLLEVTFSRTSSKTLTLCAVGQQ